MTDLRILQIIKGLDIGGVNGGAERFSIDLSEQLIKLGCKVDLCAFFRMDTRAERDWLAKVLDKDQPVFFAADWAGPNNLHSLMAGSGTLREFVESRRHTILHSHFQQGTYSALWLKKKLNVPVILRTAHNVAEWEPGFSGKVKEAISDFVYPRYLDAEAGVSKAIVEKLARRYPNNSKKVRPLLIHNGISLPSTRTLPIKGETEKVEFTIGGVGRLSEQKGYTHLLKALPQVLKRHPQARLVLFGDGELRSNLEAQVNQLGLQSQVQIAGQVNNVFERLEEFDLFVSPSLWEGLPTVIMEAMAVGVPVVATDIPGTREMITHQKNGWLVPPADPSGLAKAIIELIETPQIMQELSQAGMESVEQYSIVEIAKAYLQLYESLITQAGEQD